MRGESEPGIRTVSGRYRNQAMDDLLRRFDQVISISNENGTNPIADERKNTSLTIESQHIFKLAKNTLQGNVQSAKPKPAKSAQSSHSFPG
jgi:hypothetical protein